MNLRYILPLLIATTCSFNVQAGDRWFDVEIIVFKRNVDVQNSSEQLDQNNVYLKQRDRLEVIKAAPATNCLAGEPCLHKQNPVQITDNEMVKEGNRLILLKGLRLKEQLRRLKILYRCKPQRIRGSDIRYDIHKYVWSSSRRKVKENSKGT